jgi:hypothetical protein
MDNTDPPGFWSTTIALISFSVPLNGYVLLKSWLRAGFFLVVGETNLHSIKVNNDHSVPVSLPVPVADTDCNRGVSADLVRLADRARGGWRIGLEYPPQCVSEHHV